MKKVYFVIAATGTFTMGVTLYLTRPVIYQFGSLGTLLAAAGPSLFHTAAFVMLFAGFSKTRVDFFKWAALILLAELIVEILALRFWWEDGIIAWRGVPDALDVVAIVVAWTIAVLSVWVFMGRSYYEAGI